MKNRFLMGSGKFEDNVSHAVATPPSAPSVAPANSSLKKVLSPNNSPRIITGTPGKTSGEQITRLPSRPPQGYYSGDEDDYSGGEDDYSGGEESGFLEEEKDQSQEIPPLPENPDNRPKLIQFAEEYFGKCWIMVLAVILFLIFYKKIKI